MNFIANAAHIQPIQRFDRRFGLTFRGAKCREIMLADQILRAFVHGGDIQIARLMPDMAAFNDWRAAAAQNAIAVMPRQRRKARMKIGRGQIRLHNRNRIGAQKMIQRVAHLVCGKIFIQIEMRNLTQRMHARIGAPRAVHRDTLG